MTFNVHEQLLRQASPRLNELIDGAIRLANDGPIVRLQLSVPHDSFKRFAAWLYGAPVFDENDCPDDEADYVKQMLRAYHTGEKISADPEFLDAVMDQISKNLLEGYLQVPLDEVLPHLLEVFGPESKGRQLIADWILDEAIEASQAGTTSREMVEGIMDEDFRVLLLQTFLDQKFEGGNKTWSDGCAYHKHDEMGRPCFAMRDAGQARIERLD